MIFITKSLFLELEFISGSLESLELGFDSIFGSLELEFDSILKVM